MEFFFWVFLSGVLICLPFLIGFGVLPSLFLTSPGKLWWLVLLSGLFETIYFICLIEAYQGGDLSLVYPISRSAPLFTQIWAVLWIGEVLSWQGISGIGLVLIGLYTISLKHLNLKITFSGPNQFFSRPYLLALTAAIASSIYSVIDKVGVQIVPPIFYLWLINLSMTLHTGIYLALRRRDALWRVWCESKKEIVLISLLQNGAYFLVLMAMTMSKVSYVVAFRQVGALFGALMGMIFLREETSHARITGVILMTSGLLLIGWAR